MNLYHDATTIPADPRSVWHVVSDPARAPEWNDQVHETRPLSEGVSRKGFRYEVVYELRGVRTQLVAELTTFDAPTHLICSCRGGSLGPKESLQEEYFLSQVIGGTRIERRVDLLGTRVPWLLRRILRLLADWSHPIGYVPPALERLGEVVVAGRG